MKQPTIQDLDDKLDKIYLAVVGDEKLGIKGTNQRLEATQAQVNDHEIRLTKVEGNQKKLRWIKMGASWAAGVGSGAAITTSKAGAFLTKLAAAAGAAIFLVYLIMLIL